MVGGECIERSVSHDVSEEASGSDWAISLYLPSLLAVLPA